MSQDNYNEQELQQLESELRSMGEPYSRNAPGEEYFAGFSRRVMNRINAENNHPVTEGFISRMKTTFFGSSLRTSIVGVCAVGAIVAIVLINSGTTDAPIAITNPAPQVIEPQTTAPQAPQVQAQHDAPLPQKQSQHSLPKQNTPEPVPQNIANENNERTPLQKGTPLEDVKPVPVDAADQAANFSAYDETLSTGNDDDPVTFDKLSTSELEAVLKTLDK